MHVIVKFSGDPKAGDVISMTVRKIHVEHVLRDGETIVDACSALAHRVQQQCFTASELQRPYSVGTTGDSITVHSAWDGWAVDVSAAEASGELAVVIR